MPGRPVLTTLQFPPPFVLLNTPLARCTRIEGGRRHRINRQNHNGATNQAASVNRSPTPAAIRTLEYTIGSCPGIEGSRCRGVDRQGLNIESGQAGVDCAPTPATIRALEYATVSCPRIEDGGRCRVNRQGVNGSPPGPSLVQTLVPADTNPAWPLVNRISRPISKTL